MPLPPGFVVEPPTQSGPTLPPGFQLESPVSNPNATPTLGQRILHQPLVTLPRMASDQGWPDPHGAMNVLANGGGYRQMFGPSPALTGGYNKAAEIVEGITTMPMVAALLGSGGTSTVAQGLRALLQAYFGTKIATEQLPEAIGRGSVELLPKSLGGAAEQTPPEQQGATLAELLIGGKFGKDLLGGPLKAAANVSQPAPVKLTGADIQPRLTPDDFNRILQNVPQDRQLPTITPSTEQALINPAPKILGEGQGLSVRQMPERQLGQRLLEDRRGQWQVNELGEVIPAEQPELNKNVPREQSIRPMQQSPVLLNQPKPIDPNWQVVVQSEQPNLPGSGYVQFDHTPSGSMGPRGLQDAGYDVPDFSKLPQGRYSVAQAQKLLAKEPAKAEPTIYQKYAAAGEAKQGGQVSFAGEANKLPNRNPTAVEPPAPTLEGGELKGIAHGLRQRLDAVRAKRGEAGGIDMSIFEDVVEYGKKLFNKGKDFVTWSKLMSDDLGGNVAPYLKDVFEHIEKLPVSHEKWYDRQNKSWVIQSKDAQGNQVGDAAFVGTAEEATRELASRQKPVSPPTKESVQSRISSKGLLENAKSLRDEVEAELEKWDEKVYDTTQGHVSNVDMVKEAQDKVGKEALREATKKFIAATDPENTLPHEHIVNMFSRLVIGNSKIADRYLPKSKSINPSASESGGPHFTTTIVDTMERFKATLDTLKDTYVRRTSTSDVAARRDAVDTLTLRAQSQAENHIELAGKRIFPNNDKVARNAVFAMLESGKTGGLASALSKVAGKHSDAEAAVKFAMDPKNLKGMNDLVKEVKDLDAQNIALAKSEGISIQPLADYLKHMYEQEARPFFFRDSRSMGTGKGSMAARKFPTIFDAINAGYKPLSLDAMALVGKRTQEIYLQVQTKRWLDGYRTVLDPVSKEPVVKNLGKLGLPPEGYVKVEGLGLAVKEGYQNIFRAVTGESKIAENKFGQAALETEGGIKHGTLTFDVFHLSRIAQFARSVDLGVGYKKGLSLLEYSAKDLDEAIRQGKAPADAKAYQNEVVDVPQGKFTRRQIGSLNIQNGLNVGKHSEALYTAFVRSFPGLKQTVGRFNRYVFDKVSRGALYEAAQVEFQRIANDNPSKFVSEVARQVSRDLNIRFGNLGRQGVVKSKTMQDITQLIFLAPRWVEAMAQSEGRSAGQVGKSLVTGRMGTLGKSSATLLATYFVATQAVNYIFNGHTTFQNDNNKGHEIDAYIPPITKDGKGFWISPLSVVAELTHDVLRYSRGSKGPLDKRLVDAGARIVGNKLSPLAQGTKTAITGRNWKNEPVEGWNRVKEALITGVNPTPLPLRQAATAVKEHDIAPLERQAFSMAGIKAEPESFGDVKQRKIQALGKATLQQRAQLEKDVKGLRPTATDQSMLAAAERKIAANLERRDALLERLPLNMQGWLKTNGLHIHGFAPELAFNGTKISLTKQESKFYEDKIVEGYEKFIGPWVGKTVNQKRLDERIDQSRMWAKNQLRVAMQNGSIYEKKEPAKRFSIFAP